MELVNGTDQRFGKMAALLDGKFNLFDPHFYQLTGRIGASILALFLPL